MVIPLHKKTFDTESESDPEVVDVFDLADEFWHAPCISSESVAADLPSVFDQSCCCISVSNPNPSAPDSPADGSEDETPQSRSFALVMILPTFIGLILAPQQALLDTGAQHGVVGKPQYDRIVQYLAKYGLKPRLLPTRPGGAQGVGGASEFVLTADLPIAIQGNCGTLTVNVVAENIPLLLPVSFSKNLGMNLLMPKQMVHWEYLDCHQPYEEQPSGHLAIDIFEFPKTGWKSPHDMPGPPLGTPKNKSIKQSDYQLLTAVAEDSTPENLARSRNLVRIPEPY